MIGHTNGFLREILIRTGGSDNKRIIWADAELDNLLILFTLFYIRMCVWSKTRFWSFFFFFLINDALLTLIIQLVYIFHPLSTVAKLLQCYIFSTYSKGDRKFSTFNKGDGKYWDFLFLEKTEWWIFLLLATLIPFK